MTTARPECATCGSEKVLCDAWARWDHDKGDWVLETVFQHAECENCGGETALKWAPGPAAPAPEVTE